MSRTALTSVVLLLVSAAFTASAVETLNLAITMRISGRATGIGKYGDRCPGNTSDCSGGYARLETQLRPLRRLPNFMLLDCGARLGVTEDFLANRGSDQSAIMNRAGYSAMALSSSDFFYGTYDLGRLASNVTFAVLGTNLDVSGNVDLAGKLVTHTIVKLGTMRVGILTAADPLLLVQVNKDRVRNVLLLDLFSSVNTVAGFLRGKGVDLVVLLNPTNVFRTQSEWELLEGVDVLVHGKSNAASNNSKGMLVQSQRHRSLLIVECELCTNGKGFLFAQIMVNRTRDFEITSWNATYRALPSTVKMDAATLLFQQPYFDNIKTFLSVAVGSLTADLRCTDLCMVKECDCGYLLNMAVINTTVATFGTQVSLYNAGAIRGNLAKGVITREKLLVMNPFLDAMVVLTLPGFVLLKVLHFSVSDAGTVNKYLQVAGLSFTYNPNLASARRVLSVSVLDRSTGKYIPLALSQLYQVAVPQYIADGGDGYDFSAAVTRKEVGLTSDVCIGTYWQSAQVYSPPTLTEVIKTDYVNAVPLLPECPSGQWLDLSYECQLCPAGSVSNTTEPRAVGICVSRVEIVAHEIVVVYPSSGLYIAVLVLTALSILLSVFFLFINIHYRNTRLIRMSSPKINNITIAGSFLLHVFVILYASKVGENPWLCQTRLWFVCVGFTLTFGSLFTKTYRVHKIFNRKSLVIKAALQDKNLFGMVALLCAVDLLMLVVWTVYDPLLPVLFPLGSEVDSQQQLIRDFMTFGCVAPTLVPFASVTIAWKGVLLLFGIYLAYEIRSVFIRELNDTSYIVWCVYNVGLICAVVIPISFFLENVDVIYMVSSLGVLVATDVTLLLMFFPKIRGIISGTADDESTATGVSSMPSETPRGARAMSTVGSAPSGNRSPTDSFGTGGGSQDRVLELERQIKELQLALGLTALKASANQAVEKGQASQSYSSVLPEPSI